MHSETHHFRSFLLAVLLALLALFLSARPVQSAWGNEPALVKPTGNMASAIIGPALVHLTRNLRTPRNAANAVPRTLTLVRRAA